MIIVRASDTEIEVSGNLQDLGSIAHSILALIEREETHSITINADSTASPKSYSMLLKSICISKSEGPIWAAVRGDCLTISASQKNLDVLSSYFEFSDDEDDGSHNHFEYFDGDSYIHPESRSFVVMLNRE